MIVASMVVMGLQAGDDSHKPVYVLRLKKQYVMTLFDSSMTQEEYYTHLLDNARKKRREGDYNSAGCVLSRLARDKNVGEKIAREASLELHSMQDAGEWSIKC